MIRFKTLQHRLFAYYSVFFVLLLFLIAAIIFVFIVNVTRSNISENQIQLETGIVNSLDQELRSINDFSMNIVYTNMVRQHFKEELSPASKPVPNNTTEYSEVTTLIDLILAIISSSQPAVQANIYDLNGAMIGAGEFNGQRQTDLELKPWYEETMVLDGRKHLNLIKGSQLSETIMGHNEDKTYITLTRVFKDQNYVNQGIVEIIQDADILFSHVNELKATSNNLQIYVVNEQNKFFYPYQDKDALENGQYYNEQINNRNLKPETNYNIQGPDEAKQMITYSTTGDSNWRIIVAQSHQELFTYLNQLIRVFVVLLLATLIIILIISFLVSKRVTQPLSNLRLAIQEMDPYDFSKNKKIEDNESNNSIEEIDALRFTFQQMNERLSQAFNELVTARSQELDAKFLALQSQMNPHFLYNNLTNISVMAEEGMNDKIVKLAENMSFMLRYISQMHRKGVTLAEEIDYSKRYLECMDIRYEENLHYSFSVPKEMYEIKVPMLLIQPLVENIIKHGLDIDPPWTIDVTGRYEGDYWWITVSDNGPGFDSTVIKQLYDLWESLDDEFEIPDLHVEGMGIKNIMIRLKLMFRNDAYLHIENHHQQGASVTIGGKIEMK